MGTSLVETQRFGSLTLLLKTPSQKTGVLKSLRTELSAQTHHIRTVTRPHRALCHPQGGPRQATAISTAPCATRGVPGLRAPPPSPSILLLLPGTLAALLLSLSGQGCRSLSAVLTDRTSVFISQHGLFSGSHKRHLVPPDPALCLLPDPTAAVPPLPPALLLPGGVCTALSRADPLPSYSSSQRLRHEASPMARRTRARPGPKPPCDPCEQLLLRSAAPKSRRQPRAFLQHRACCLTRVYEEISAPPPRDSEHSRWRRSQDPRRWNNASPGPNPPAVPAGSSSPPRRLLLRSHSCISQWQDPAER